MHQLGRYVYHLISPQFSRENQDHVQHHGFQAFLRRFQVLQYGITRLTFQVLRESQIIVLFCFQDSLYKARHEHDRQGGSFHVEAYLHA